MTGSSKETSTDQVHNFRRISLNSFQPKLHWESIFILPRITTSHYRKPVAAIKEFSPVAMRRQGLLNPRAYFNATKTPHGLQYTEPASVASAIFLHNTKFLVRAKIPSIRKIVKWGSVNTNCTIQASDYKGMLDENQGESSDEDEDDELCPVECVREFKTDKEFLKILERAKETDSLVVVDFYRTSCGSCKYIEQGFTKLCRVSGDQEAPVIFLKHNVIDEYDEQSEVAEKLRIKAVPLFHFYKNGVLQEAFATRDKERILAAILKYA